jgi:uncharacterized membrane protein
MKTTREATDRVVGGSLLTGLTVSVAVMLLGLVFVGVRGGHASHVIALANIVGDLRRGDAPAMLDAGILLLFATPILGIIVAGLRFVAERDRAFIAITILLLCLLALGILLALR